MPKNVARMNENKLPRDRGSRLSGTRELGPQPALGTAAPLHQITAEAAHDLNNALGSIRLYLDLLEVECRDAARVRQRVQQMKPAIQHASDLTQTLLGLHTQTAKSAAPTNLNRVLEGMGPMLSTLPRRDVALRLRLSPSLTPVSIDPAQVIRIVLNLVLNACDAMPQGGEVMIETSNWQVEPQRPQARPQPAGPLTTTQGKNTGWVMLRVRDTGRGMSEAIRSKAFQPFFTTKSAGNSQHEVSGLGLPSVLRMVQIAGGTIQVESIPGKGTEVTMLFPGPASRPAASRKSSNRKESASERGQQLASGARGNRS